MTNKGYVVIEVRPETREVLKGLKGNTWNYDRTIRELMQLYKEVNYL